MDWLQVYFKCCWADDNWKAILLTLEPIEQLQTLLIELICAAADLSSEQKWRQSQWETSSACCGSTSDSEQWHVLIRAVKMNAYMHEFISEINSIWCKHILTHIYTYTLYVQHFHCLYTYFCSYIQLLHMFRIQCRKKVHLSLKHLDLKIPSMSSCCNPKEEIIWIVISC